MGLYLELMEYIGLFTNRQLLIGRFDVSVKEASKNFVTVSVFEKYGFDIQNLKNLVADIQKYK